MQTMNIDLRTSKRCRRAAGIDRKTNAWFTLCSGHDFQITNWPVLLQPGSLMTPPLSHSSGPIEELQGMPPVARVPSFVLLNFRESKEPIQFKLAYAVKNCHEARSESRSSLYKTRDQKRPYSLLLKFFAKRKRHAWRPWQKIVIGKPEDVTTWLQSCIFSCLWQKEKSFGLIKNLQDRFAVLIPNSGPDPQKILRVANKWFRSLSRA